MNWLGCCRIPARLNKPSFAALDSQSSFNHYPKTDSKGRAIPHYGCYLILTCIISTAVYKLILRSSSFSVSKFLFILFIVQHFRRLHVRQLISQLTLTRNEALIQWLCCLRTLTQTNNYISYTSVFLSLSNSANQVLTGLGFCIWSRPWKII